ncbi:sulfite exporter TauE/SafE family protein [Clostridiaceae bacterium 35-E11]
MIFIFIGLLSGIIGGMGIGGGTILIPSLIFFTSLTQQQAQSVNLLSFIPVACIALLTHFRNNNIEAAVCLPLIALGILGSICGSLMAVGLPSDLLKKLFGFFLLGMGLYEFFWKSKKNM